jgi:glucan 1,3-beta-glucosidase
MYDAHGQPKFPLQGAMSQDSGWRQGFWGAGIGAVAFLALGLALGRRLGRPDPLLLLLSGTAGGAIAVMQWRYLATTNRNLTEWVASVVIVLVGWILYGWILLAFAGRRSREQLPAPESIFETLDSLDHREFSARPAEHGRIRSLGVLRFVLLLGFAYVCLGLAVDARYRGFPTCLYVLPVMALSLLSLFDRGGRRLQFRLMPEETALAGLAGACALLIALREGWHNPSALGLSGLALAFALSLLIPAGRLPRDHQ